jgi:hypothetical protein
LFVESSCAAKNTTSPVNSEQRVWGLHPNVLNSNITVCLQPTAASRCSLRAARGAPCYGRRGPAPAPNIILRSIPQGAPARPTLESHTLHAAPYISTAGPELQGAALHRTDPAAPLLNPAAPPAGPCCQPASPQSPSCRSQAPQPGLHRRLSQ